MGDLISRKALLKAFSADLQHLQCWDTDLYSLLVAEIEDAPAVDVKHVNNDGCEYCKEDSDGYRKMNGAFAITNPFHGSVWNIETCHCKPRQIYFCPMCGRSLYREDGESNV